MTLILAVLTSSYTVGPITAIAVLLIARRHRAGWIVGLCAQTLWLAYTIDRREWGLLASVLPIAAGYAYGLHLERRRRIDITTLAPPCDAFAPRRVPPPPPPPPEVGDPGR